MWRTGWVRDLPDLNAALRVEAGDAVAQAMVGDGDPELEDAASMAIPEDLCVIILTDAPAALLYRAPRFQLHRRCK